MRTDNAVPVRLEDYRPTEYDIARVDLDFRLQPEATRITARLAIERRDGTVPGTPLVLNGDEIELVGLAMDGVTLAADAYTATPDKLVVHRPPSDAFTLDIITTVDPTANTKLMGLYRSGGVYCTQCEAEGFRRITYYLDRPDVLSVFTTRIEARKSDAPLLLSNGNPASAGTIDGTDRHFAVWHDPFPKPSYLFALVGGDLAEISDSFTTRSGRDVTLKIFVEHGKEGRAGYAMDALKRSMKWDEDVFGCEYDLDIFMVVAVSDFNMGAMENKGLNIFNDKYVLADPQTATDQDYANIEAVIAHEYFHNWTGNRITCRDWFQLCLKEGLTVFRDQEFSSDQRSRPVKRISDVRLLMAHQFPEDAGPLAHPVRPRQYFEINNFYTATVYEKGAEVVRMLHTLLGEEGFRKGMDLYFERHDGDATTIEAFLACFAEANGTDLDQFALWYHQSGTPRVTARISRDSDAGRIDLSLHQTCPPTPGQDTKQPFLIPMQTAIVSASGTDTRTMTLHLTEEQQDFSFDNVPDNAVLSLNGGFTAPILLDTGQDDADLAFIARHDPDTFNQWQALQTLCLKLLKASVAALRTGADLPDTASLNEIMRSVALDDTLDPAFRALALTLPAESDIARDLAEDIDTDAVHQARRSVMAALGAGLSEALESLEPSLSLAGTQFSPDAASAGRRALLNTLYMYLACHDEESGHARIYRRFDEADNMTDRFASLTTLIQTGAAQAPDALQAFHDRFQSDALVMDKWFAAQAAAPGRATLDKVRSLTEHPGFSFSNPNRIRALIGGFAAGNQAEFNRPDGKGYDYVVDVCERLDKANPQVAARLLSAFRSWRSLEPGRRARARAALAGLIDRDPQSPDVRDILSRSLADPDSH